MYEDDKRIKLFWWFAILTVVCLALPGILTDPFTRQFAKYIEILAIVNAFTAFVLWREYTRDNETDRKTRLNNSDPATKRDQIKLDLAREIRAMGLDKLRELNKGRLSLVTVLTANGPVPEYEFMDAFHQKFRVPQEFVIEYLKRASQTQLPITGNRDGEGFSDGVHWQDDPNQPTLRQYAEDTKRGLQTLQLVSAASGPNRADVYDWQELCDCLGLELWEIEK